MDERNHTGQWFVLAGLEGNLLAVPVGLLATEAAARRLAADFTEGRAFCLLNHDAWLTGRPDPEDRSDD